MNIKNLNIMESNGSIEGQKEIEIVVNSYENAVNLLKIIGAEEKSTKGFCGGVASTNVI